MEIQKQIEEKQMELVELKEKLKTEKELQVEEQKAIKKQLTERLKSEQTIIKNMLNQIYTYNKSSKSKKLNSNILVEIRLLMGQTDQIKEE